MKLSSCRKGDVVVVDNEIGIVTDYYKGYPNNYEPIEVQVTFESSKKVLYVVSDSSEDKTIINLGPGEVQTVIRCGSYDSLNPPDKQVGSVEVSQVSFYDFL